jgi:hypothetical protein
VFLSPGQVVDVEYRDQNGALLKTVPGVQAVPAASGNVDQTGVLGEVVPALQVVYLSDGSGGKTAGRWWLGGPGQIASVSTIGMTITGGAAGATVTIRLAGNIAGLSGLVVGGKYFLSNTPGALSLTPAVNFRVLGQADSTTSLTLFANPFNPRDQVEKAPGTAAQPQLTWAGPGSTVILNGAAPTTIQGIKAGYHGQRVRLIGRNYGVDLAHQSPSAAAADRLQNLVTSAAMSMLPGSGWADYEYDADQSFWRMVGYEQGGFITPPYNAADYGGSGGMTWAPTAGQVTRCAYYLRGKSLQFQLRVTAGPIGGVADVALRRNIPGGFTGVGTGAGAVAAYNAGAVVPGPVWNSGPSTILFYRDLSGSPTWSLGNVSISADMWLDIS